MIVQYIITGVVLTVALWLSVKRMAGAFRKAGCPRGSDGGSPCDACEGCPLREAMMKPPLKGEGSKGKAKKSAKHLAGKKFCITFAFALALVPWPIG